jgi:hypothetical protein
MSGNRDRVALACFLASAVLAGGNGVSIRFSNRELPPLWGAGLRFALAYYALLRLHPGLGQTSWLWFRWPPCCWQ